MTHHSDIRPAGRVLLRALAAFVALATPALANFVTISPTGTKGPGGTITFAGIGPNDSTSANVNTNFTTTGNIPIGFTVSNSTPISLYGSAVNSTSSALSSFTAQVTGGSATFQAPNDPFDPYGTYTDTLGFSVTLNAARTIATFAGGSIAVGDALDFFLGLVVSDPTQAVTVTLTPSAPPPVGVPEPASLLLGAIALAGGSLIGRGRNRHVRSVVALGACLVGGTGLILPPAATAAGPVVAPAYAGKLRISVAGTVGGSPTQMAVGPDGRVYVMTIDAGPISYAYNATAGTLSGPVNVAPQVRGIGLGFRGAELYLSSNDGTIHKLTDANGNGVYGETGETDVAIVTGLPQGDHNTDQIQVAGNTLYVGIGRRTINGRYGAYTSGALDDLGGKGFFAGGQGRTYGDSAYNGTIAWIRDLNAVVNQVGSANAFRTEPPTFSQALIQKDNGPFTATDSGKLVVHSAGTRNPFGLCLDATGGLWFTNNFNRTATLGNGQAGFGLRGDQLNSDFSIDVHDQLFHASQGADYGYWDSNWRGVNPMLTPGSAGYHLVRATTFDNSFNKGPYTMHDPANPDGLGPSASADGCAFAYGTALPADLQGNIFVVRYNGTITEAPGGAQRSLTYNDLVAVNPTSGRVVRVASGFNGPLAVLSDDANSRVFVADINDRIVYMIQGLGL